MNQKEKEIVMVAVLVLFLGLLDIIAVQTGFQTMFMLAVAQVIGGLLVAGFLILKKYF